MIRLYGWSLRVIYHANGKSVHVMMQCSVVTEELDHQLLRGLQDMLMVHNPYVQAFREAASCGGPNVNVCLHASPKLDMRRYNIPRVSEVAAFIPEADEPSAAPRDVIVRRRDGRVQRIHEFHAAYDPLHFVLLFPRGEQGWTYNIPIGVDAPRQQRSVEVEDVRPYQPSKARTVISPKDFAAFYLMNLLYHLEVSSLLPQATGDKFCLL